MQEQFSRTKRMMEDKSGFIVWIAPCIILEVVNIVYFVINVSRNMIIIAVFLANASADGILYLFGYLF